MAKRKGESYLGGHSLIHSDPDFDETQAFEQKRSKQGKYGDRLSDREVARRRSKSRRVRNRQLDAMRRKGSTDQ